MNYSKGISWFDDCRIPFVDENDIKSQERAFSPNSTSHKGQMWNNHLGWEGSKGKANETNTQGRFPANLLCSDDMLNDGNISKSTGRKIYENDKKIDSNTYFLPKHFERSESNINDKGSNSRYYDIDAWFNNLINNI